MIKKIFKDYMYLKPTPRTRDENAGLFQYYSGSAIDQSALFDVFDKHEAFRVPEWSQVK